VTDLLSAAGLLLTALTIIYGLWYNQIMQILETIPPLQKQDRIKPYREVRRTISDRMAPLVIISGLLTLIFVPDAVRIVCASLRNFATRGFGAVRDYDAVATSFVLVTCLLGFLQFISCW
jgi:hypothetical protein